MEKEINKEQELKEQMAAIEDAKREEFLNEYQKLVEKTGYDFIPKVTFSPQGMDWERVVVKVK